MEVHSSIVADLLGCSQVWVHKLRKAGESPPYQKRGKKYFYSLGAVIRWVIERQTRPLVEQIETLKGEVAALKANTPEAEASEGFRPSL